MAWRKKPARERIHLRGRIHWTWGRDWRGKPYQRSTGKLDRASAATAAETIEAEELRVPDRAAEAEAAAAELTINEAYALVASEECKPATTRTRNGFMSHVARAMVVHGGEQAKLQIVPRPRRADGAPDDDAKAPAGQLFYGMQLVNRILKTDFEVYAKRRRAEGAATYVIMKEMQLLIRCLRKAADNDRYTGKDTKTLMPDWYRKRENYYTPGSGWLRDVGWCNVLINVAGELYGYDDDLRMYLQGGVRNNERSSFRKLDVMLDAVDLDGKPTPYVWVNGTKTKKDGGRRKLYLSPTLLPVIRRRMRTAKRGEPLFVADANVDSKLKRCWRVARARILASAVADATQRGLNVDAIAELRDDLDELLPTSLCCNDLRRTFCSHLARAGVPLHHCAELMGHKSLDMILLVYKQIDDSALAAVVTKLPMLCGSPLDAAEFADAAE